MIIWGKVIGFFLGALFWGPLGAVIGVLLGAFFDKGLHTQFYQYPRQKSLAIERTFFTATFTVMGYLAKADGRVSENEIAVARKIMSQLELNDLLKREAIELFNKGRDHHFDLSVIMDTLWKECRYRKDLLRFFIEIQLDAALADGDLTPQKRKILLHICERLRFSPMEFEQLRARHWAEQAFYQWFSGFNQTDFNNGFNQQQYYQRGYSQGEQQSYGSHARPHRTEPTLQDAYAVLGVSSTSSVSEIKKAYRKLMNEHHPDKLLSKGLPESMIKIAKEKTQQIGAAYELVRNARGFR